MVTHSCFLAWEIPGAEESRKATGQGVVKELDKI